MNIENLAFLQDVLIYLGFGKEMCLNSQLAENMSLSPGSFELHTEAFFGNNRKLEVTLHFRKSEQLDMYFFDKYEVRLLNGELRYPEKIHTFYIKKGTGVALKEAFNLLEGRAVNKDLINLEGQKYNAWIQLNFSEKDEYNNYKVKQFRSHYGYDLEKTLEKYPIKELKNTDQRSTLIRSLRKGNRHLVSFDKTKKAEKMFIEANPQLRGINIYPVKFKQPLQQSDGDE
jgi:hypothetical protein